MAQISAKVVRTADFDGTEECIVQNFSSIISRKQTLLFVQTERLVKLGGSVLPRAQGVSMRTICDSSQLHVEVKHHYSTPRRYTWEIRPAQGLAVEESRLQFDSWEEASQAGNRALKMLNAAGREPKA